MQHSILQGHMNIQGHPVNTLEGLPMGGKAMGVGMKDEGEKNQFFFKKGEGFAQPGDGHEPQTEEYNNSQYCTPDVQERQ